MIIIGAKCIGCGQCVILCPVQAIQIVNDKAIIDKDECVECGVCYRDANCPTKALKTERLKWPRIIRNPFSSVVATHKLTNIPGRGTEEMKTNDITNRFKPDEYGIFIEIGRPGIGSKLKNIELFTTKLVKLGVEFEKESPVTAILADNEGHIQEELKEEKVLSAIIEFKISKKKINDILKIIKDVDTYIDTVFTVGLVSRVSQDGTIPVIEVLESQGFSVSPNAKINIGLGRE